VPIFKGLKNLRPEPQVDIGVDHDEAHGLPQICGLGYVLVAQKMGSVTE
jgi:hypothetical protein